MEAVGDGESEALGIGEFTDALLVAIYDTVNAYDPSAQPAFYTRLAADLGAGSIVDLGCGTGLITCALAAEGARVTGVDPAPLMLEQARRRPHGAEVHWLEGDARTLGARSADLAIMSGHVAQFFLTDEAWRDALTALHAASRPDGRLAFESRNPGALEWERWTAAESHRSTSHPTFGRVDAWYELEDEHAGIVSYTNHYLFADTGDEVVSPGQLRFRTRDELVSTLADAGFAVEHVYGDWDRRPAGPTDPELIVVAVAT